MTRSTRATFAWAGGYAWRVKIEGRYADRHAGKRIKVARNNGTTQTVILKELVPSDGCRVSAGACAFYSFRRVSNDGT
jgi:hypothetical protein